MLLDDFSARLIRKLIRNETEKLRCVDLVNLNAGPGNGSVPKFVVNDTNLFFFKLQKIQSFFVYNHKHDYGDFESATNCVIRIISYGNVLFAAKFSQ